MNKKIIITIVVFLLLVPFRLPIGVLFITLVTHIANMTGNLSHGILVSNVIVTKIIYDIVLCWVSVFNAEIIIRGIFNEENQENIVHLYTILIAIAYIVYIIFDAVTTYDLYYVLIK